MDGPISRLGTTPASVIMQEWVGWFRRRAVGREVGYLDWTIDGAPLREVVAWPNGYVAEEVTPVRNDDALPSYRIDYIRALLGEPVSSEDAVMPDGRVPLLVCPVDFDLGCRALTAEVVREGRTVEWRDIAWQSCDDPLHLAEQGMPVVTVAFDREQYDGVIRALLEGGPQ